MISKGFGFVAFSRINIYNALDLPILLHGSDIYILWGGGGINHSRYRPRRAQRVPGS